MDAGQHWTPLNSSVNWCTLTALDFVSNQLGWVLSRANGSATALMRTADGGTTWTEQPWLLA